MFDDLCFQKQQSDRDSLGMKLKIEQRQLLEAKEADFERLKKRLKNAESELKKTHAKQLNNKHKILPRFSSLALTQVHSDERSLTQTHVPRPPSRCVIFMPVFGNVCLFLFFPSARGSRRVIRKKLSSSPRSRTPRLPSARQLASQGRGRSLSPRFNKSKANRHVNPKMVF